MALLVAVALLADGHMAFALARRAALREGDTVLVEAAAGRVRPVIGQQFALAAAADVHAAIKARTTIGKTLRTVPRRQ